MLFHVLAVSLARGAERLASVGEVTQPNTRLLSHRLLYSRGAHAFRPRPGPDLERAAEECVKRAGFVVMAQVATKDKRAPAALLHRYLDRAEREASDERNFVKKAVNWAIRAIDR